SVSGVPSGTTASFNPTSVNAGASSTLSVNVGAATAPGSYTLTITGTGSSATHNATVTLIVTASGGVDGGVADGGGGNGGGIVNGDFETGNLNGWITSGNTSVVAGRTSSFAAQVGNDQPGADSAITQGFT